jgi:hypothetical protein
VRKSSTCCEARPRKNRRPASADAVPTSQPRWAHSMTASSLSRCAWLSHLKSCSSSSRPRKRTLSLRTRLHAAARIRSALATTSHTLSELARSWVCRRMDERWGATIAHLCRPWWDPSRSVWGCSVVLQTHTTLTHLLPFSAYSSDMLCMLTHILRRDRERSTSAH